MSYDGPWKNRRTPLYTQYCHLHECPKKLLQLLKKYGAAFDDNWQYRIAGRKLKVVIREPLWLNVIESGRFAEKPKSRYMTRPLIY